jgi:hypothetical protein
MSDDKGNYWIWKAEGEGFSRFAWRLMLGFGVAFAGLLMYSLFDLVFLFLSSEARAIVTEVYREASGRDGPIIIEYKFKEPDGFERKGKTNLGSHAVPPSVDEDIAIQYLPRWFPAGPDGTRPARPLNWTVLGLLCLCTAGLGVFSYQAIAASGDKPRKTSRRR